MQENEYINEKSLNKDKTASEITPIIIEENRVSRTTFIAKHVQNQENSLYCINGTIKYEKFNKYNSCIKKVYKRELKDGESFEISIHSKDLFNLYSKLKEYYICFNGKEIPDEETTYIKLPKSDIDIIKNTLKNKDKLQQILDDEEISQKITIANNVKNLEKIYKQINDENIIRNINTKEKF